MVRVGRLELPASCSQSKRATNCATPGYEVFQLWSNMGSTPVFDLFPARGKTLSALASQGFPGFWRSAARTPASRSQITCAANCATPGHRHFSRPGAFFHTRAAMRWAIRCVGTLTLSFTEPETARRALFILLYFTGFSAKVKSFAVSGWYAGKAGRRPRGLRPA